jgi:hypothetical protein
MKPLALTFLICLSSGAFGQGDERVVVPSGSNLMDVLTIARVYYYPEFRSGQSLFKDGTTAKGKLNYNTLNEEVEFITAAGDTMAIAKDQMLNIKSLTIDTTTFYYANGYLQQLKENASGRLLRKQLWVVVKRQKIGGYDEPISSTAAIFNDTFYNLFGIFTPNLVMNENITLAKKSMYFFGDKYNLILPANKKNVTKVFSNKKKLLEDYLKNNDVDFYKLEDVVKLFDLLQ